MRACILTFLFTLTSSVYVHAATFQVTKVEFQYHGGQYRTMLIMFKGTPVPLNIRLRRSRGIKAWRVLDNKKKRYKRRIRISKHGYHVLVTPRNGTNTLKIRLKVPSRWGRRILSRLTRKYKRKFLRKGAHTPCMVKGRARIWFWSRMRKRCPRRRSQRIIPQGHSKRLKKKKKRRRRRKKKKETAPNPGYRSKMVLV